MTKKHFTRLAYGLAMVEPSGNDVTAHQQWLSCVHAVSKVCQESNQLFNQGKFIAACQFDYWKTHKVPS